MMLNLRSSYFAIASPVQCLDRLLNPSHFSETIRFRDRHLIVEWTQRAQRALTRREHPLLVEMQLYFSCVVKKRVLFHDAAGTNSVTVNDKLSVSFQPVESQSCDPEEFAKNFPVKRQFDTAAAANMGPKKLLLDYKRGRWIGEYRI